MPDKRQILVGSFAVVAIISTLWLMPTPHVAATTLPKAIADDAFWQMIDDFSEAGGFFRSDNFVSNERQYQWDISDLKRGRAPGGVYLGVGPDQNSIRKTGNIEILDGVVGRVQKDSSRCNRDLIVIDAAQVANSPCPVDPIDFDAHCRGNRGASRKVYVRIRA